jgi:hypothetical protein
MTYKKLCMMALMIFTASTSQPVEKYKKKYAARYQCQGGEAFGESFASYNFLVIASMAEKTGMDFVEFILKWNHVAPHFLDQALGIASRYALNEELIKLLIQYEANVNVLSDMQTTPLSDAIFYCRVDLVRMLIAYGADTNACDWSGRTALSMALHYKETTPFCYERYDEIIEILRNAGAQE